MSVSNQRSWDANRFFETLNYFGEVPFIGSFRWLQQLMGQKTTFTGVDMSVVEHDVVVLGSTAQDAEQMSLSRLYPSESWQSLLETQLQAQLNKPARIVFNDVADSPTKLAVLTTTAKAVVVLGTSTLSTLLNACEEGIRESADLIERPVFDFSESNEMLAAWGTLDDVVMGGVSQSGLSSDGQGQAVFAGNVSDQNSGGFASVRTKNFEPPFSFLGWEGLRLRIKGDGQRYKFILRNSAGWDSPAYIYGFDTEPDTWLSVDVPFSKMVPTFRAKSISDAPALNPASVHSFQLMLSKFEYDRQLNPKFETGPFSLMMSSLSAYRRRQNAAWVVVAQGPDDDANLWQTKLSELGVNYHWLTLEDDGLQAPMTTSLVEKLAHLLDD